MAATDEIISQPESVIKKPQVDNGINTIGREKQLREVKSSNSSTLAEKKSIVCFGDSIIKPLNGYAISKKLENCKVLIRSFSGFKFMCFKDHIKPSIRGNPDHIVLHFRTNDLNTNRVSNLIAKSIIDLAITIKGSPQNVTISNIIMRNDNLNDQAMEVNGHLKQFCIEKNIFLIDRRKTFHPRNINKCKLHLNKSGT